MAKRWPNSFWFLGPSKPGAVALAEVLGKLKAENKIGAKIAMVSVADAFGIELATAARVAFKSAGFELALDKTYPIGTQDMQALLKDAIATGADSFVAFSYPPDTIGITDAARVLGYNPKVFYTPFGTALPVFKVSSAPSSKRDGCRRLERLVRRSRRTSSATRIVGREPDRWASPSLRQSPDAPASDRKGRQDRSLRHHQGMQTGTFDTIMGKIKLADNIMPIVGGRTVASGEFVASRRPATRRQVTTVPKPVWAN